MTRMPVARILLVAEGSGGHVIPALEVARSLATAGASVKLWYAQRPKTAQLVRALAQEMGEAAIDVDPLPMGASATPLGRVWQCGRLWHRAQQCFETFHPDVVVGFGGWVSAPIVLAARRHRIGCLLHEQNVVMGRTNRWLAHWVDRIAVSFPETQLTVAGVRSVMTGLPVRRAIGHSSRIRAAERFGFVVGRPTLLVLGGSQGSQSVNRLVAQMAERFSPDERRTWQVLHITGSADETFVRHAYAAAQVTACVRPFLSAMDDAYAQADLVIARAGASTIAELARSGRPALLLPYPYASGHQRANARVVGETGGGLVMEETDATPERLLGAIRRILADARLRQMMGAQMRALEVADAAERLTQAIFELCANRRSHAAARVERRSEVTAGRARQSEAPLPCASAACVPCVSEVGQPVHPRGGSV